LRHSFGHSDCLNFEHFEHFSLFSLGLLGRLSVRDDTARDGLSLSFPLGFSFEIKKNLDSIEVVAFVPFVEKVRWLTAHLFVDSLEEAEKGPPIS